MKAVRQPNRLGADAGSFSGREIDRGRPLTFKLNGRTIHGFAGDTVLSAALASGIVQAGWRQEQPLALDERFAPLVTIRDGGRGNGPRLPMERLPATDGLDLVSVGPRRRNPSELRAVFGRLVGGPTSSLEREYGGIVDLTAPWHDAVPETRLVTDMLVVGGGVAGMRAAIAAGSTGESVLLVERRPTLGGDARVFGATDEEQAPATLIAELQEKLAALKTVRVLVLAEVFAIYGREVRLHQVVVSDGAPVGRVTAVSAARVVLATGSFERLPVFAGNRTPGVTRSVAAFHLADRYGVWIGQRALVSTVSGYAYRVAVEARKAGVEVGRIADTRLRPQSRFIDFAKAYGLPLSFGVTPRSATRSKNGEVVVRLSAPSGMRKAEGTSVATDQLIVCGGFQPELTLWHMAGGQSRWSASDNRMEPVGKVDGIEVIGAAAGWRSTTACLASAAAGVAMLLGRRPEPVDEQLIDPMFETPDDATPVAEPVRGSGAPAYLDSGTSLAERPSAIVPRRGVFSRLRRTADPAARFLAQARALTVGDIAAAVQFGAIAPSDAGTIAQERCVAASAITVQLAAEPAAPALATPLDAPAYPAYLVGRFGTDARVWHIEAADRRSFETGCLVYPTSDKLDPTRAVGVVLRSASGAVQALIGGEHKAGDALVVRDLSGTVAVTLAEPTPVGPEA